jgi:hypothetical protein
MRSNLPAGRSASSASPAIKCNAGSRSLSDLEVSRIDVQSPGFLGDRRIEALEVSSCRTPEDRKSSWPSVKIHTTEELAQKHGLPDFAHVRFVVPSRDS